MEEVPIQISHRKFTLRLRFATREDSDDDDEDSKESEAPETKSSHSPAASGVITLKELRFGFAK